MPTNQNPSCTAPVPCQTVVELDAKIDTVLATQHEIHDDVKDLHTKLFVGNGQPSHAVRLDRLEQQAERRDKWYWVLVAAVVGLFFTIAATLIASHWDKSSKPAPATEHKG